MDSSNTELTLSDREVIIKNIDTYISNNCNKEEFINEIIKLIKRKGDEGKIIQRSLCTICCNNDIEVIIFPCKHASCCVVCSLQNINCIICRVPIVKRQKMYLNS